MDVGYGEIRIIEQLSLGFSPGDRIGLLGPNGAGKSTLIKLLAGTLQLQKGDRETAQDLKIGYFAQHQLDQLHLDQTPLEHLARLDRKASEQSLRNFVGGFGFSGERADSPVAPFSGGEKARLVLALLVYQRPNLLLLDEPTNHLDLEMRHALSLALQNYEGAMVLVSHDRHLLRTTCDQLLLVNNGQVTEFKGDLDDYPRWLAERERGDPVSNDEDEKEHSATARKERKRQEAERRRQLQPLRNKLKKLEQQLEQLSDNQAKLESTLAQAEIYEEQNKSQLKKLLTEKSRVDRSLNETEESWLQVSEALDESESLLLGS